MAIKNFETRTNLKEKLKKRLYNLSNILHKKEALKSTK